MPSADMDEIVFDFSRFYILTILYEGSCHGYSIISKFKKKDRKRNKPKPNLPIP